MEVSTPRSPSPKPEPYSSKCGGQAFVLYSKRWMEMIRSQGSSPPNWMILGGTAAQPLRADQSVFSAVQNRVVIGHVESICMLRSATRYDPLPIICSVFPVLQPCTANGHCQGIPMSSSSRSTGPDFEEDRRHLGSHSRPCCAVPSSFGRVLEPAFPP